jgi:cysteinyl-tRNA synthetase
LQRWQEFRNSRNYSEADGLKERIEACGVKLSVGIAGPEATKLDNFDRLKLEALK